MSKVKILVDSTSDIPPKWLEDYDIGIVPLHINWPGGASEDDCRDLSELKDFYRRLSSSRDVPKTSQPTPEEFKKVYQELEEEGYEEILVFCLSADMSGTYNSAVIAKSEVHIPVHVVDTKKASGVVAIVARHARELLNTGMEAKDVVKKIEHDLAEGKHNAIFYVSDFDFLRKGGRISRFQSFVGTMLKIHVAIYIEHEVGMMVPFKKVRGEKKAQIALVDKLTELWPEGSKIRVLMVHVDNEEGTERILELLKERFDVEYLGTSPMGKVIATHVGPGTAGFAAQLMEG
ncbi:MAG: fatty acid kinase fatty acid binding subunit [Thermotogota bacterium]|nr:fatty acid kinase fatty acid binding subunit [Thermotogota bacterium]MDK2865253.1 fatty acid kinase fatty acid binding subunit [Thermotogota bacterium]HCZ06849.1 DegV family protein [Thermotogota bacterium]